MALNTSPQHTLSDPLESAIIQGMSKTVDPDQMRQAVVTLQEWIHGPANSPRPPRGELAAAVRLSARTLAQDAPGHSVEVRVPPFVPETAEEQRVEEAAKSRIGLRKAIQAEMEKQTYEGPSDAPRLVTRFLAKPTDVNWGGNVHGGTAMEWIDEAGVACSMEWSGERTVAVYAGGIRFYKPIAIGDLIEVDARMMRTDRRSMQMSIHVRSGSPRGGREHLTEAIHATVSYIGIDEDDEPLEARQFIPVTDEDKRLHEHAQVLRDLRADYRPMPLISNAAPNHVD